MRSTVIAAEVKRKKVVDYNMSLYVDIFQHIRGHNKHLSEEYLDGLTNRELLNEVHPTYFDYFWNLFHPRSKK